MRHFQGLIVSNSLIDNVELSNLGKVNVTCGKNNSGKTALLKSIQNPEHTTFGRPGIDDDGARSMRLFGRVEFRLGHGF